jgi:2-dehydropantoate 2-reductase
MRYVIIGAGAIGGGLAARLAQGSLEHPPLLIARGDNAKAIATSGMRLRTPDEDVIVAIDIAGSAGEVQLRHDDVLVFATKTQQVERALLEWVDAPVLGHDGDVIGTAGELLPVFMALNGVESERIALRLFARVFAVCVWIPAVHLTAGEFILRIAPRSGAFIVGRYGIAMDDADRALLSTVQADWTASSFAVHVADDVMRWKYSKLVGNLGNALQALLGANAESADVAARLRAEATDLYREAGIEWASAEEEAALRGDIFRVRPVPGTPDELGGSSWQSVARGAGSIETDYLNGEIVLLARSRGLSAPLNETVQRLTRHTAVRGAAAGSLTLAELEHQLGAALTR